MCCMSMYSNVPVTIYTIENMVEFAMLIVAIHFLIIYNMCVCVCVDIIAQKTGILD